MTTETVKTKRTKKTGAELLKEIGRRRITEIANRCVPNAETLANLERLETELQEARAAVEVTPVQFQNMARKVVEGLEFRLAVLRSNVIDPNTMNDFDRALLVNAAKRILKAAPVKLEAIASFVLANAEAFPIVGTKY